MIFWAKGLRSNSKTPKSSKKQCTFEAWREHWLCEEAREDRECWGLGARKWYVVGSTKLQETARKTFSVLTNWYNHYNHQLRVLNGQNKPPRPQNCSDMFRFGNPKLVSMPEPIPAFAIALSFPLLPSLAQTVEAVSHHLWRFDIFDLTWASLAFSFYFAAASERTRCAACGGPKAIAPPV